MSQCSREGPKWRFGGPVLELQLALGSDLSAPPHILSKFRPERRRAHSAEDAGRLLMNGEVDTEICLIFYSFTFAFSFLYSHAAKSALTSHLTNSNISLRYSNAVK